MISDFKIKIKNLQSTGFTLIETLIYITIIAVAVSSFVAFGISVASSRNKNYVVQEVQANGRFVLDVMSQRIRASSGINIVPSTFGSDPGVLSLEMTDVAKNPTIINLDQDNGTLQITEGASSPVVLTSAQVNITNLVFTNLTPSNSRENIRVEMTIEYDNPSGDVEFNFSQSLGTAVSVRK